MLLILVRGELELGDPGEGGIGALPSKKKAHAPSLYQGILIDLILACLKKTRERLICSADEERGLVKRKGRDGMCGNYKTRERQGQGKRETSQKTGGHGIDSGGIGGPIHGCSQTILSMVKVAQNTTM